MSGRIVRRCSAPHLHLEGRACGGGRSARGRQVLGVAAGAAGVAPQRDRLAPGCVTRVPDEPSYGLIVTIKVVWRLRSLSLSVLRQPGGRGGRVIHSFFPLGRCRCRRRILLA